MAGFRSGMGNTDQATLSNDPAHPQWQMKTWRGIALIDENGLRIADPGRIFLRFAITYVPGL